MKTFQNFITEKKDKSATFSFGRFNPHTTGHALLVKKLKELGSGTDTMIFSSHSNDKRKNPLSHRDKVKYLKKFFGRIIVDANVRTVFEIANELHKQGYTHVNMVVGSDRVKEFENLLTKYNGVKARHGYYKFKEINVVSAGERDPDADDVSGMSASKMRQYAEDGNFEEFAKGVPSSNSSAKKQLYKAVRKGMGIAEGTLPNYMMEDLITEGVYDPGTFKAVFLMGGPGSGKSTVVDDLGLKALGLKLVNSDKAFENGLKKAGLSLDLRVLPADVRDPIRNKAKKITGNQLDRYIGGRLGLVFDTTSAKISKIQNYKKMLDTLGYESKMVYVRTSLDNAQKRNEMRPRKLPPQVVQKDWEAVEKNASKLKSLFKKDFVSISNDDDLASLKNKTKVLFTKMMSWSTSFPKNKTAHAWRNNELEKKAGRAHAKL